MANLISIVGYITKIRPAARHVRVTIKNMDSTTEVEIPHAALQDEQLTLDTYIQVVGTLATYRHHRCRNHHMVVKATSIRCPPPVPFDPTLHFAELLATLLYER